MAEKLLAQQVEGTITAMVYSSNSQIFAYGTAFGSIFIRQIVPGEEISSSISFDEDEFDYYNKYFPGTQLLLSCKANNDAIRALKWLDDVTLISTDSGGGISITQIVGTSDIEECAEKLVATATTATDFRGRDDPISACTFEVILMKKRLCKHPISCLEVFVYLEHLYLAAGDDEGYVHIINVCNNYSDLKILQSLGDAGDYITGFAWSEFQSKLYASSADGTLYCYEIGKGKNNSKSKRGADQDPSQDIDILNGDHNDRSSLVRKMSRKQQYPVFRLKDNSSPEEFSLTCMIMDPNERYIYCGTSEGSVLLFSVLDIGLPVNKLRTTSESIESVIRLYRNYYLLGASDGVVHLVGLYPPIHYGVFCSEFKGAVSVMELSEDKSLLTIAEHFSDVFYMMDAKWVYDLVEKQEDPGPISEDEQCSDSEEIDLLDEESRHKYVRAPSTDTSDDRNDSTTPIRDGIPQNPDCSDSSDGGPIPLKGVLEAPLRDDELPKDESSTTDSEMAQFFNKVKASAPEPSLKTTIQNNTFDRNKVKARRQAFFADLK
ncbi:WD40 repeat protein [Giardia duodenalis]|uniref:WD40 repeat protein n=1 Tax=Giardia intestinalis (strain ATCC 50803 / WB clone C6) TaxID=184922 RepID=A8BUZ0_GIAIC|nr:WD40 repeat protein [Giardia intestinalis]KAE8304536.1 WD40 repeat protein [Giardia intestinalis]|eukprot:XP_001704689.1 Hypothetical protein GL50803_11131 [Giardia lamblia ATCC 50803]